MKLTAAIRELVTQRPRDIDEVQIHEKLAARKAERPTAKNSKGAQISLDKAKEIETAERAP